MNFQHTMFNEKHDFSEGPEPMEGNENIALRYFMDYRAPLPSAQELNQVWPISSEAFIMNYL